MIRSMMMLLVAAVALCMAPGALAAAGSDAGDASAYTDRVAEVRIFVLTYGPGDDIWEAWGHNAIRVIDPRISGDWHDVTFNWGTFDFDSGMADFIWNFLKGRLLYSLGVENGPLSIESYKKADRSIRQQELNLTPAQKRLLLHKLEQNYRPENRKYRYDYYRDNCSTRVRDILNDVVGGNLAAITKGVKTGTTYRWHTRRADQSAIWLYVALQAVLGRPVDRPLDEWQEMFLPEKLHDRLGEVKVKISGYSVPLVSSDVVLYASHRPPEPTRPPTDWPWFLLASLGLGAAFLGLGHVVHHHPKMRKGALARWGLVLLAEPWLLLMGFGGAICWWAWFCTDHVVARNNENVMHISVLALPLLVGVPMLVFNHRRGARFTKYLAVAMVGVSAIGWFLKALPSFYQVNEDIIALCLPANVALAFVAWKLGKEVQSAKCRVQSEKSGKNSAECKAQSVQ